jgi:hypothetical protein
VISSGKKEIENYLSINSIYIKMAEVTNTSETATRFNTIDEIIQDSYFNQFVRDYLAELLYNRRNRPAPKQGFYYKRDWYDIMSENGSLYSEYFIKHISSIWLKQSSLSSGISNIILLVCNKAVQKTLAVYSKQETPLGIPENANATTCVSCGKSISRGNEMCLDCHAKMISEQAG